MQDDRVARYRQAATTARKKATTAIVPKLWLEIANDWDQLAGHVEVLGAPEIRPGFLRRKYLGSRVDGASSRYGAPPLSSRSADLLTTAIGMTSPKAERLPECQRAYWRAPIARLNILDKSSTEYGF
jgi:hypothetical protein